MKCSHHSCPRESSSGLKFCDHHRAIRARWSREYRARRAAAKRCVRCGEGVKRGRMCQVCRDKINAGNRASYQRRTSGSIYRDRRQAGLCGKCGCEMLPEWRTVNCPTCNEALSEARARTPVSKKRAWSRKYQNTRYKRLREAMLCVACEQPTGGPTRCRVCAADHVRCVMRRRAEAARRAEAVADVTPIESARPPTKSRTTTSTPIADYHRGDLGLGPAAVRFVELCNGITMLDIGDEFGLEVKERDSVGHALLRAVKAGVIRRESDGDAFVYYPIRNRRAA